jgi:heme-degrading monooxygenase HmoA
MFIAMVRFNVGGGREQEFEQAWRERRSDLQDVPGFVQFALLRRDTPGEYISHSIWHDRQSFVAWTESEAFAAEHRQGSLPGILEGPPHLTTYEAIIVQNSDRGGSAP